MSHDSEPQQRQSKTFLYLYALAWAGGAIAYVPFLTVLLPVQVADAAGDAAVDWLAYIAFVGAIFASIAHIAFGWLSDKAGTRRVFVAAGLILSCTLLVLVGPVTELPMLLLIVSAWQFGLNLMLAPLAAWAGDCVPDRQKGQLGGLLSIAPAVGAMAGTFVTIPGLASGSDRLWLVAFIVALCVLPALVFGRPRPFPELMAERITPHSDAPAASSATGRVARMWIARLLVQIAEAALFAYVLLWFRSMSESVTDNHTAIIFSLVLILGVPLTIFAGHWADRHQKPIIPLVWCAAIVAGGLLIMALSPTLPIAIAGYLIFGVAGTVFLSQHTAQTLRVLPNPKTRGRDLGFFNLTNTVPSLIMPWLTLALVPVFGFSGLFLLLALLASIAFFILLTMRV